MRGCPRGQQRSVDRGARRPAIEPRKYHLPGRRRRSADGRQYGWARYREPQTARRGRRHWHARTLLAREPGDLTTDRSATAAGPHREGEEPQPMMHGREKSDSAIVAGKPTNNAVLTAAEPVERRAGAKGNASQQSTHRTQSREHVLHALERVRRAARPAFRRHTPEVGAVCPNWARTDLGGLRRASAL